MRHLLIGSCCAGSSTRRCIPSSSALGSTAASSTAVAARRLGFVLLYVGVFALGALLIMLDGARRT